ncbi:MAG: patatin-like phospholipase family protein [Alphaproteobacteria bacterium]|nr:patatin-like phospholipase family protein [Alphaproteobacteria bacterium]
MSQKKNVGLALQGGGTHLAFSWGVLDYLLEDGRIHFEGGSGTSAGGLTCAALAQGLMKNGNPGARVELEAFWRMIHEQGKKIGLQPSLVDEFVSKYGLDNSMTMAMLNSISRARLSPYQWNPYGAKLFADMLNGFYDIDKLSKLEDFKLFLTATNVKTGRLKIFSGHELTVESFMASACIPILAQAVEIDGQAYWDGGYIGNPSLFPLIYNCETSDILVILVIPHVVDSTPHTYAEVSWRMQELMHTNTLTREMRAIEFVTSLIDQGIADKDKLKRINIHVIEDHQFFSTLSPTSRLNTDWKFLTMLYERGRQVAETWMKKNYKDIGKKSTIDINEAFV